MKKRCSVACIKRRYTSLIEEWRPIEGYENYEVSSLGRVRSKGRYVNTRSYGKRFIEGQIIEGRPNKKRGNYVYVSLCAKSRHKQFKVHRLVAQAFIPNPDSKPQINHIDNDPTNNRTDNLEWVTAQENSDWKVACGRSDNKQKKPIKATEIKTGNYIIFESSLAAVKNGFSRPAIWRCMTGEYSHHHGYTFEFANG